MTNLLQLQAEKSKRHLKHFLRYSWDVLEEDTPLDWNWHIDAICDYKEAQFFDWLAVKKWSIACKQAAVAGNEQPPKPRQRMQNLCINVPPGSTKSRIVMVCYPAWVWIYFPAFRFLALSGSPRVATRDSLNCRKLIESEWYQDSFEPDWVFSSDQNAKMDYTNSAGGYRRALGIGAKVTGERGDELLMDDLNVTDEEEEKSAQRDTVNQAWDLGLANRINDPRVSLRTLIGQRVHEDDASGHFAIAYKWTRLVIPMEYDAAVAKEVEEQSPIDWVDPRSEPGQLMFPERFEESYLLEEFTRLGTYGYSGQYLQTPSPAGGVIFDKTWFETYSTMPDLVSVWDVWDTALKAGQKNDESSGGTFGLGVDEIIYLLWAWHGREETPQLEKRVTGRAAIGRMLYGNRYKGTFVEDKVSGTTLMQYVRQENPGFILIPIAVNAGEDKQSRARGVSPLCEARRVRIPDTTAFYEAVGWVRDVIEQLTKFPKAKHDDMVDMFVHGLRVYLNMKKPKSTTHAPVSPARALRSWGGGHSQRVGGRASRYGR